MSLDRDGYLVFKVTDRPSELNKLFWGTVSEMPEFFTKIEKNQTVHPKMVLGGFGALANPSSFHHANVRKLRYLAKAAARPRVAEWANTTQHDVIRRNSSNLKFECLFDRMCIRSKFQGKPQSEAWHRDIFSVRTVNDKKTAYEERPDKMVLPKGPLKDDVLLGGFMNCDETATIYLSCVPGNYQLFMPGGGFMPLTSEEIKQMDGVRASIPIPPGHAIIFFQGLLHEIVSTTPRDLPTPRLFIGFRVTLDNESLFTDSIRNEWIKNGIVPRIPSGQIPPAWGKSHVNFHGEKIQEFKLNVHEGLLSGRYFLPLGPIYPYTPMDVRVVSPTPLHMEEVDDDTCVTGRKRALSQIETGTSSGAF